MSEIILTNHVKQRASERGVSLKDLDKTIRFPDKIVQNSNNFSKKHIKNFGAYQIALAVKRQDRKWTAVSVWKNTASKSVYQPFFLEKLINHFLLKAEQLFNRRPNR